MSDRLVVDDLTVAFDSGGYVIKPLDGLSFTAEDGELVVLLGPSGCGKTTLLSCLAGLLTPAPGGSGSGPSRSTSSGARHLADYRRQTVGVVFQAFNLIASLDRAGQCRSCRCGWPACRGLGRRPGLQSCSSWSGSASAAITARPSSPGGSSNGWPSRRALVHDPPLILADEPTAHLDHIQVEGVLRLMRDLASPGRIIVVSTHDDRVSQLADRVIELAPHFSDADRQPEEVHLADGEILFRQGERGELIYQVVSGLLEVYRELADGGQRCWPR